MRLRSRLSRTLLVALAYLGIAAWILSPVLRAPATLLPENPHLDETFTQLGRLDTNMVLWVVTGNAHRLLTHPAALRSEGQCHPLPKAYTLGEHMLGEGLLAALPLALSGDPILSYNLMLIATLWIAALAMFALALHFTRSVAAAFVAGALFCLEPTRIQDVAHPFVHGDLWTPLALLFLHRTFARGGFANGLACALFLALTVLESLYALVASLLVVVPYALYAMLRHRREWRLWLAPLLLAVLAVAGIAAAVLGPYLTTRGTWGVLVRPGTMFLPLGSYAPGRFSFPGWTLLVLALAGLGERAWRRRDEEGEDPRLAFACAGLLVFWCSVRTLPLAGLELASPLLVAKQLVPGLDAVRALAFVGRGAVLAWSLLAAYGMLVASARLGARGRALLATAVVVLVLAERFQPALAAANFGAPLDLVARAARPDDEDIALLRGHARGALLDIPLRGGPSLAGAEDLLLASYSPRPTATCYNSFPSPLQPQLAALIKDLPSPAAVDALVALGFETLLLHADRVAPRNLEIFLGQVSGEAQVGARVALLGRTDRLLLFRLSTPLPVASELAQLAATAADGNSASVGTGRSTIAVAFHNGSQQTFLHRAPIVPTRVEARWHDRDGTLALVEQTRMLLPLALAPGATAHSTIELGAPPRPGPYGLTIHLPGDDGAPLAWTEVIVEAAPAVSAADRTSS
jgi:hypothetical protein